MCSVSSSLLFTGLHVQGHIHETRTVSLAGLQWDQAKTTGNMCVVQSDHQLVIVKDYHKIVILKNTLTGINIVYDE